jgi:hypothetical protein
VLRSILVAVISTSLSASAPAQTTQSGAPAKTPVRVFLVEPADRPDKPTVMTAARQTTREVKHFASTWGGSLFWYFNDGPDCEPTDLATTLVDPPAHGRFFLHDGTIPGLARWPAPFPKNDPRSACPNLAIRNGFYQPDPGFIGRDHMTIAFREGDAAFTDAIEIDVRRAERPNPLASAAMH